MHEIKLDGFRMAARIDNGRVQLLDTNRPRLDGHGLSLCRRQIKGCRARTATAMLSEPLQPVDARDPRHVSEIRFRARGEAGSWASGRAQSRISGGTRHTERIALKSKMRESFPSRRGMDCFAFGSQ